MKLKKYLYMVNTNTVYNTNIQIKVINPEGWKDTKLNHSTHSELILLYRKSSLSSLSSAS